MAKVGIESKSAALEADVLPLGQHNGTQNGNGFHKSDVHIYTKRKGFN